MKFKLKTLIAFFFTFLILIYPVYKYTSFKILQFNFNEDLETFNINTFIKLRSVNEKFGKINKRITNINQNFFNGKKVINLKKDNGLHIFAKLYRNNKTFSNNNNNNIEVEEIFYLPSITETLFEPFSTLEKRFQKSKFAECKKIKRVKTNLKQIDDTHYILSSRISQTRSNDTELEKIFKKCLPEAQKENIRIYINELNFLNMIKEQDNLDLLENFIKANENLFSNEDIKKKFIDEIKKIQKIFFEISTNEIIDYYFNKPFNYDTKTIYKKDFSSLNVSIIMSLLLNILIFYILYFLRKRLKFLKIIF